MDSGVQLSQFPIFLYFLVQEIDYNWEGINLDSFWNKKMTEFRKTPTEADMLAMLRKGEVAFPPFSLTLRSDEGNDLPDSRPDAVLELAWNGRSQSFAVECKSRFHSGDGAVRGRSRLAD